MILNVHFWNAKAIYKNEAPILPELYIKIRLLITTKKEEEQPVISGKCDSEYWKGF